MKPRQFTEAQLKTLKTFGIEFPTPLPTKETPPDEKMLARWSEIHSPFKELHPVTQKIVANINHINYKQFFSQLQKTINDFNQKITEPYILWIAQTPLEINPGCSDTWVVSLALEHLGLRLPVAIASNLTLLSILSLHKDIKHILLLDDCAYSGKHIEKSLSMIKTQKTSEAINSLNLINGINSIDTKVNEKIQAYVSELKQHNLHIGIPFLTAKANKRISDANCFKKVSFLSHKPISIIRELLTLAEINDLKDNTSFLNLSLTYFDHTFPDCFSTLQNIQDGNVLLYPNLAMTRLGVPQPNKTDKEYDQKMKAWEETFKKICKTPEWIISDIIKPYRNRTQENKEEKTNNTFNIKQTQNLSNTSRENTKSLRFFKPLLGATCTVGAIRLLLPLIGYEDTTKIDMLLFALIVSIILYADAGSKIQSTSRLNPK